MKEKTIKPIFIFSLPRSGSTLLQRMLASHDEISSVAEPWVLLPLVYPLKREGVYAEYSHASVHAALQDFCAELPHGEADYLKAIRKSVLDLYQGAANEKAVYFLDKTPRYHLICDEIIRMFPDGTFIFLWRNPLAVVASIIETWGGGRWNIYKFKVDLFDGLMNMIKVFEKHKDKVIAISYEDLLVDPATEIKRIVEHLEIEYKTCMADNFSQVQLKGRMGDPTGVKNYVTTSKQPLEKWKETLTNPLRKVWCRKYLSWLGANRLRVIGYNMDELVTELHTIPIRLDHLALDLVKAAYGVFYCSMSPTILKHKWKKLPEWKRLKNHC